MTRKYKHSIYKANFNSSKLEKNKKNTEVCKSVTKTTTTKNKASMENVIVDKIKLLLLREQSKQQGIGTQ